MAYVHVAHDVRIGNHTILGQRRHLRRPRDGGRLGGVGAFTGVHQFCRIGRHAIVGGYSVVTQDVLPFSTTVSEREIKVFGANKTGLERRGFPAETIDALRKTFRLLTHAGLNTTQAVERIRAEVPALPRNRGTARIHATPRRGEIAAGTDDGTASIAGNGRFPILALESARALGHEVVVVAIKEEAARKSRRWPRAATGSRSAN